MAAVDRLAFALDVPHLADARRWVERLRPTVGVFKVGLELFTAAGPAAVEAVHTAERSCFLDLKLHDIPATVGRAAASAAGLGVRYLTVHAAAGAEALTAARRAIEGTPLRLLAITVLTSLDDRALARIGMQGPTAEAVARLGALAMDAGAHGVVCGAAECAMLRERLGPDALLVVPGIRPAGSQAGDQRRVATPTEALRSGADLLVVGRPIRQAPDPAAAAKALVAEIAQVEP